VPVRGEEVEVSSGLLFVVSSPSGAGKTTLSHKLLEEFKQALQFSVSYTTRPKRPGEQEGIDYHFVDAATFQSMIDAGEFAEWAEVHGHRYGTPMFAVREALDRGRDVLFDIDWQGGTALAAKFPRETVLIYVMPPSMAELERRLRRRATDADQVIERRLRTAREEVKHYVDYKYLIRNDDLSRAYQELRAIYLAEPLLRERQEGVALPLLDEIRRLERDGA
jgi:guanylate kinase